MLRCRTSGAGSERAAHAVENDVTLLCIVGDVIGYVFGRVEILRRDVAEICVTFGST